MPSQNPNLKSFWKSKARERILYGGRMSSKSTDACIELIKLSSHYTIKVLCTRMFQNRLSDSVYSLLQSVASWFGQYEEFEWQSSYIRHRVTGSEFLFYGLSRNISEIKSIDNIDICYIEEAENLTPEMWKVLEPTIRNDGSQIWIVFNPRFVSDFVYQNFILNKQKNRIVRKINYDENPFINDTQNEMIEAARDRYDFAHIYLGEPLSSDDNSIIKLKDLYDCVEILAEDGAYIIGFDIADSGNDRCALALRKGNKLISVETWKGDENGLMNSIERCAFLARQYNALIIYDNIGIGASVGSKLNEMGFKNHFGFNAGATCDNKQIGNKRYREHFSNLKAQSWYEFNQRVINKEVSLINDEELLYELAAPHIEFTSSGLMKVESKESLKRRINKSPDKADAVIMCFYQPSNSFIFELVDIHK